MYTLIACGRSPCWDCGFESRRGHGWLSVVSVMCQVQVSVAEWSLVQRSPTECDVSECDREASIMRRSWPTGGYCVMEKNNISIVGRNVGSSSNISDLWLRVSRLEYGAEHRYINLRFSWFCSVNTRTFWHGISNYSRSFLPSTFKLTPVQRSPYVSRYIVWVTINALKF